MRHELIHAFLYISIHAPTRGATKWIPCCGQSAHISIHAPARGATNSASMMSALSLFQSTLPQGERRLIDFITGVFTDFNPRSHKGSDEGEPLTTPQISISIHAPTRGATSVYVPAGIFIEFQSTLPQGERLAEGVRNTPYMGISIHAPTRGATMDRPQSLSFCAISIHAPTRGATSFIIPNTISVDIFQSTLPQGERLYSCIPDIINWFISIHAPTRGATFSYSAHHHCIRFQSTLPQGERHRSALVLRWSTGISIHAPTRGATSRECPYSLHLEISIHAPTRGATTFLPFGIQ